MLRSQSRLIRVLPAAIFLRSSGILCGFPAPKKASNPLCAGVRSTRPTQRGWTGSRGTGSPMNYGNAAGRERGSKQCKEFSSSLSSLCQSHTTVTPVAVSRLWDAFAAARRSYPHTLLHVCHHRKTNNTHSSLVDALIEYPTLP